MTALAEELAAERARLTVAHVYGAGLMPGRGAALLLASEREQTHALLEHERAEASLDAQVPARWLPGRAPPAPSTDLAL